MQPRRIVLTSFTTAPLTLVAPLLLSTFLLTALLTATAHANFAFTKIVDNTDAMPDRTGKNFAIPGGTAGTPAIHGNTAVFSSFETGTTHDIQSLWAANISSGALTRVVDSNVPIPGGSGGLGYVSPFTINSGVVAFRSNNVDFRATTTPHQVGFYSVPITGSPVQVLANQDTVVPFHDPTDAPTFGTGSFYDIGTFNLDNGHFVFSNGALYAATVGASSVTRVADKHTPIAEANYAGFAQYGEPDISGNRVSFVAGNVYGQRAIYTGPLSGLVVGPGGAVTNATRIASYNTAPPEGGGFSKFDFYNPLIDGNTVVFRSLNDRHNEDGSDDTSGLYSSVDGVLHKLVDSHTPVPGGTGNFQMNGSFDLYSLSGGRVVFKGTDANNIRGLYLVPTSGGVIEKIVAEGDKVDGHTLGFGQAPIQPNSLDGDHLVFRTDYDFIGAIYMAAIPAYPAIDINNPRTFDEGSAASPGSTTFAVTLSNTSLQTVTVHYQTADGTAKAGSDYVARSGTLTFAPGETTKYVRVNFIGDGVAEPNETLFVDLSAPVNASISDSRGAAYIRNDDGPSITIDNAATIDEGNSGTKAQTFTVHLSAASTNTITVDYATANGSAGPADFTAASGTLTFSPGQTSKSITVLVKGDTTVEPNETYKVNLSHPTFAVLGDSQSVAYIRNDDGTAGAASVAQSDEPSS